MATNLYSRLDRKNASAQRAMVDAACPPTDGHVRCADGSLAPIRGNAWQARTGEQFIVWKHAVRRWCVAGQSAGSLVTLGHATRSEAMIEANRLVSVALGSV